jgi:hypothetical protein
MLLRQPLRLLLHLQRLGSVIDHQETYITALFNHLMCFMQLSDPPTMYKANFLILFILFSFL